MNCVGQRLVKVGWVIDAASLMVYCFRLSRVPKWLVEDGLVLVCLCRLIDSDDFTTDEDLKTRILEDDFQCGQSQIQYLMQKPSANHNSPDAED